MNDAYFRKTAFNKLEPANPKAIEALKTIAVGSIVKGKLSKPRNSQHHRKFFALLGLVFENQEHYKTPESMLIYIKAGVDHGEWVLTKKFGSIFIPWSISFAKMDQVEFSAFYNKCVDFIVLEVLPGIDKQALTDEVLELL